MEFISEKEASERAIRLSQAWDRYSNRLSKAEDKKPLVSELAPVERSR
jgi:hypothetical protein